MVLKERTKEECACIPTSLVYPFLALPPTSWTSPPTFSKLVCVFVYLLTSYCTRGSKEDKLVSGLLSFPLLHVLSGIPCQLRVSRETLSRPSHLYSHLLPSKAS